MDYTTVDFKSDVKYKEENIVTQWITTALGRDDALITRNLVDTYFTPYTAENPEDRITVKMKVITTGLTEAILANMGPDVANMTSVDTITWGLRNAVEPLDAMNDFDTVMTWIDEAAVTPLQITNAKGEFHTYGLPVTMDFYVMFYRSDVLESMGLEAPQTWSELYDMLPALLSADMEIGMPGSAGVINQLDGLKIFLYQMGSKLYNDGGYSIALDDNLSLDAFESYCGMFSKYKSPIQYDFTRFRTGEVPIIFGPAVTTYNTLMTYYDIRGLWKMAPLLGTEQENGTINRASPVTVTGMVIPRGATNPAATWEYLRWTVSPETQKRLARERLMVNANPTTKYNSPTIEALLGQAWTDEEYVAMEEQCRYLVGIREYPGNYIVSTYVVAAFMEVYSYSSDASDEMLDRVGYINKEISRKRQDFKMDYFDAITGEYHAGRYITEPNYYE